MPQPVNSPPDPTTVVTRADLGIALQRLRGMAGLTVRELAEQSDGVFSTIAGWMQGRNSPTPASRDLYLRMLAACGVPTEQHEAWWAAVVRVRSPLRTGRTNAARSSAPYLGFSSFGENDAELFFGRSAELTELVERIVAESDRTDGPRIVLLTGPSGIGKSSLVNAGLVRETTSGRLAGTTLTMIEPGLDPVSGFDNSLPRIEPTSVRHVVVLDQFGEAWGHEDPDAIDTALSAAVGLATRPDAPVTVIAVQANILEPLTRHPEFARIISFGPMVLGPMSPASLREVIEEPARACGVTLEPGLVDLILADSAEAGPEQGILPLVSHALLASWENSDRDRITVRSYLDSGRLTGAAKQTADTLFERCTPDERRLVHAIMLSLISVEDDGVVRRLATHDEIANLSETTDATVYELLARLAAARLVVIDERGVQLAHPALVRAWPRLTEWVDRDRYRLALHRRLRTTARLWVEADRADDYLLTPGTYNLLALPGSDGTPPVAAGTLADDERDLMERSRARIAANDHRARRRRINLRLITAGALVLALVAGIGFVAAVRAGDEAERAHAAALSRQIALQSQRMRDQDPSLAAQLAIAAFRTSPTREARSNLLDTSSGAVSTRYDIGGHFSIAVAPRSGYLAVLTADRVGIRSVQTLHREAASVEVPGVTGASRAQFDLDEQRLFVGTQHGVAEVDVSDPHRPRFLGLLPGFSEAVADVAVARGRVAITAASGGPRVFDRTPAGWRYKAFAISDADFAESMPSIAITADGALIATSAPGHDVTLWRRVGDAHEQVGSIPADSSSDQAIQMRFTADGNRLGLAKRGKRVELADVSRPEAPQVIRSVDGFRTYVNSVAFTDGDATLVASGSDGRAIVVDLTRDLPPVEYRGSGALSRIVGLPGQVITAGSDGMLRAWPRDVPALRVGDGNLFQLSATENGAILVANGGPNFGIGRWSARRGPTLKEEGPFIPSPDPRFSGALAVSANGTVGAFGTVSGEVYFADLRGGGAVQLAGHIPTLSSLVEGVASSGSGDLTMVGGLDSDSVVLIDSSDIARPTIAARVPVGTGAATISVSVDGRLAVVGTADGRVLIIDVTNPEQPTIRSDQQIFQGVTLGIRFDRAGKRIAATSDSGTVAIIDVSEPADPVVRSIGGPLGDIYSADFSADGDLLAVGGSTGEIWVYDASDAEPTRLNTLTSPNSVWDLRFSDESTLLTSGENGNLRAWELDPAVVIDAICGAESEPPSEAEWSRLIPGADRIDPCD